MAENLDILAKFPGLTPAPPGYVNVEYIESPTFSIFGFIPKNTVLESENINYDSRLSSAYDAKLTEDRTMRYPVCSFNYDLYHPQLSKDIYFRSRDNGDMIKCGSTNYKEEITISFSNDNLDTRTMLISITDCSTPETSSSSPSYISHQFASFVLLRSISKAKCIFEDKTVPSTPDITVVTRNMRYYIDITTMTGSEHKIKLGSRVLAIDKYTIIRLLLNNRESNMMTKLISLSYANDQLNVGMINSLITKQNITKRSLAYREDVLRYFLESPLQFLQAHSSLVHKALTIISRRKYTEPPVIIPIEPDDRFPFHRNQYSFNQSRLLSHISQMSVQATSDEKALELNRPEYSIDNDEIRIKGDTTNSEFFKRDKDQIMMSTEMYNILMTYGELKRQSGSRETWHTIERLILSFPRDRESIFLSKLVQLLEKDKRIR